MILCQGNKSIINLNVDFRIKTSPKVSNLKFQSESPKCQNGTLECALEIRLSLM